MRARYVEIEERLAAFGEIQAAHRDWARELERRLDLSWIYHDHALEGVPLTATEIADALAGAVATDATLVPMYIEVKALAAAIALIRAEAGSPKLRLGAAFVKKLHQIAGAGLPGRDKVSWRRDLPLHRAYFHEITPAALVPSELRKLLDFCATSEFQRFHPLDQAAAIHWGFMRVYPFPEGSGRLARLLQNLLLMRHGYPPAIIHAIDRQRYYETLRHPNTALRLLVAEAAENALAGGLRFFEERAASLRRRSGFAGQDPGKVDPG